MPASRPSWKGYIKLALVTCPVSLWPATSPSERIAFRQINKKTGNRIRYHQVDERTREPVESYDRGKGYEYDKDQFLMVEDEELKSIEVESSKTIEIDSFVPRAEIDERFLDSPYYIAPTDRIGAEAFSIVREAMRDKSMAALARVVLSSRERVIMLQPWDRGMLGTLVRYPYELREPDEIFRDIPEVKIDPQLLQLAEQILRSKSAPFDPTKFVDRYEQAVIELLEAKRKGLPADIRTVPTPGATFDLMEALKRSIEKNRAPTPANDPPQSKAATTPAAKSKKAKPRVEGQRELLLPISGGKKVEEQPVTAVKPRRKAG